MEGLDNLSARLVHHGVHMVWKQTRVPSLSKITNLGLKNESSSFLNLADGDVDVDVNGDGEVDGEADRGR